ncbi:hypothetical protein GBA65_03145 [Rubrobacter marinus]|uniref:Uncharacterized protein n=1 Tax=Rubrobacter marinus TaxID=2653852 RepID=A0A6G8PT46_9ACTN|nr:hypothetical protein [Rubrobacter marinus]QIN77669.1 hypothetical protein GBA65_03145 [Rubrobacter marinus]
MAAPRSQGEAQTLNAVEVRLSGGMLALVRFLMTLQNKRMPVARFTVGREEGSQGEIFRVTILLDCPPESSRRYATLLSALEDVEEIEEDGETLEVALLKVSGAILGEVPAGIGLHEEGGTVVATGPTGKLDAWLASMGNDVKDAVRLGPVARPGTGGA